MPKNPLKRNAAKQRDPSWHLIIHAERGYFDAHLASFRINLEHSSNCVIDTYSLGL